MKYGVIKRSNIYHIVEVRSYKENDWRSGFKVGQPICNTGFVNTGDQWGDKLYSSRPKGKKLCKHCQSRYKNFILDQI